MRLGWALITVLVFSALMTFGTVSAQSSDAGIGRANPGITGKQADAILSELHEMRLLLEKLVRAQGSVPSTPVPAVVTMKVPRGTPMLGDESAPVTMVEFMDLQCPFCKRYEETAFPEIRRNLINTGKVRYYSRDFPLDMHPFAQKAAVAGHCADEQGKFWRMREVLVTDAANLGAEAIVGKAKTAGLEMTAFNMCLASPKYDEPIRESIKDAASLGVQGTPSFILGKSNAEGVTGKLIVGSLPYATIEAEVKKLIDK